MRQERQAPLILSLVPRADLPRTPWQCLPHPASRHRSCSGRVAGSWPLWQFRDSCDSLHPVPTRVVNPHRLSAARGRELGRPGPKSLSTQLTARHEEAAAFGRK